MESFDLRLGNLVLDIDGKIGKITSISDRSIVVNDESIGFSNLSLKGIPIDNKWLIKFGYQPIEGIFDEIHFFKKGNHKIWKPFDEFLDDYYRFKIKYVHQLQNLYFALNQEELIYEQ
ncbi:hypothetical protein [Chryseobacterium sp. 2R14A]|uniref:hypothetical protein n=1 Tax=Chryseobacterium sp. 2R14A TaxID=3380353 RepID=UPI003CEA507D